MCNDVLPCFAFDCFACLSFALLCIALLLPLEIGGCELVEVPPNREMLCKRCEHVSECECNVIREGVAVVVRSFQNIRFFLFVCFSAVGPLTLKLKRLRFNLSQQTGGRG